ncbi:MAG: manganese efflux pump MntP family protein [Desulfotalea sp.]
MSDFYILGLAIALAMDAFAVSISVGISLRKISFRQGFRLSFHFGLFQALMPIIGWIFGNSISIFTESYAHWIAFFLLAIVGTNMIREAFSNDENETDKKDPTRGTNLIVLSIATSIDALAVGLSLSMLDLSIVWPAIIIGIVASCFTLVGMHLGKKISELKKTATYAEILGGIVLWAIGLNILFEKYAG